MNILAIIAICAQVARAAPYGPVLDKSTRKVADLGCKSSGEEIVVCAKVDHPTDQRLNAPTEPPGAKGLPPAEMNIGNAKVGLKAENGSVGGFTSPRIMLGITIPIGTRRSE